MKADMEDIKQVLDTASIGTMIAAIVGWLPHISALLTVVWMALRIYETKTVQRLLGRKGENHDTE